MHKTAKQLYSNLEGFRWQYVDRARQCSKLTLPYIMPEEGFGSHSRLNTPFASIGARGVNNLASKLLLALLPPNAPFFRLNVDDYALQEEGTPPETISSIEKAMMQVEDAVMAEVTRESYRTGLHEALKHLIITGNALLYLPDEGGMRVFHLDRFVVKRDPMGKPLIIATREDITKQDLPEEIAAQCDCGHDGKDDDVELYTAVVRKGNKWHVWQEVDGIILPDSEGVYEEDACPFIPLRFSSIAGEHYGRGYVEEYLGDIQSLETLTKAIVEGSSASAKVLFLVNPNGTTRAATLAESPNGAIVQGNASDITCLQVQKGQDFQVAQVSISEIKDRLGHAFLLTSGAVRNAERVTAEEIRMLSMELETALGGVYSLFSSELSLPMVNRIMKVMNKRKKLPKVPKEVINPIIITGVEALGRGNDLQKLDMFLGGVAQMFGPQALQEFVRPEEYLKRRATSLGIKTEGLVKSQEELQQEAQMQQQAQQQAMLAQMAQKLGPAGIKAASDQQKLQQQQQPQPQQP